MIEAFDDERGYPQLQSHSDQSPHNACWERMLLPHDFYSGSPISTRVPTSDFGSTDSTRLPAVNAQTIMPNKCAPPQQEGEDRPSFARVPTLDFDKQSSTASSRGNTVDNLFAKLDQRLRVTYSTRPRFPTVNAQTTTPNKCAPPQQEGEAPPSSARAATLDLDEQSTTASSRGNTVGNLFANLEQSDEEDEDLYFLPVPSCSIPTPQAPASTTTTFQRRRIPAKRLVAPTGSAHEVVSALREQHMTSVIDFPKQVTPPTSAKPTFMRRQRQNAQTPQTLDWQGEASVDLDMSDSQQITEFAEMIVAAPERPTQRKVKLAVPEHDGMRLQSIEERGTSSESSTKSSNSGRMRLGRIGSISPSSGNGAFVDMMTDMCNEVDDNNVAIFSRGRLVRHNDIHNAIGKDSCM